MFQMVRSRPKTAMVVLLCLFAAVATWVLRTEHGRGPALASASETATRTPLGYPQLVAVEPMATPEGEMCERALVTASARLMPFETQDDARTVKSVADTQTSVDSSRAPVRVIRDTFPTYSAIAVDTTANEVFLQDENLFGVKVFDRLANTPSGASFTEPKRLLGGKKTKLEFNCGLYVDPQTGDLYSVNNDTTDMMVIFARGAQGDVSPQRELSTPHRTYAIAVDEAKQELFLTVEHPPAVAVYSKTAEGKQPPLRFLEGDRTGLQDPHGIAVDTKNQWMFVSNHGAVSYSKDGKSYTRTPLGPDWVVPIEFVRRGNMVPGSGRFDPPSITVYPLQARGDTPPLRIIQGPKTQLNWPAHLYVDQEEGELYVANDAGDSILVFRTTDSGDAAPTRVLQGPKTGIKNPTGVFLDSKNRELWVSNMGNHSATVYPQKAQGDVRPLRTIRSAPLGKIALAIGNPGAVGYDSKRDQILVPN